MSKQIALDYRRNRETGEGEKGSYHPVSRPGVHVICFRGDEKQGEYEFRNTSFCLGIGRKLPPRKVLNRRQCFPELIQPANEEAETKCSSILSERDTDDW